VKTFLRAPEGDRVGGVEATMGGRETVAVGNLSWQIAHFRLPARHFNLKSPA
jgi:hypothetical protein